MVIMKLKFWIFVCAFGAFEVNSFIFFPDQLKYILENAYLFLPRSIKKGTDSRVAVGFRIGPNANFQVQFELGPQNNTQPIGPNASSSSGTLSKKRQTPFASQSSARKVNYNGTNLSKKWHNRWKFNLTEDPAQNLKKFDLSREDKNFVHQLRKLYEAGSTSNTKKNQTGDI